MKYCISCERTLPLTEFWKRTGATDGLQTYCKRCQVTAKKHHMATHDWHYRLMHSEQNRRWYYKRKEARQAKEVAA